MIVDAHPVGRNEVVRDLADAVEQRVPVAVN